MKLNDQKPEKIIKGEMGGLYIHSIFDTIQGEGPFSGVPATFIRLSGCNLQCPFCDTDYTSKAEYLNPSQLVWDSTFSTRNRLVVITGGEPFRQDISRLVNYLANYCFKVQIETNGTLNPRGVFGEWPDIICSPKTKKISSMLEEHITAYKYVIEAGKVSKDDGLPIIALGNRVNGQVARPSQINPKVYITPLDVQDPEENKRHIEEAVNSCIKFGYTFNLQIHKLIGLE